MWTQPGGDLSGRSWRGTAWSVGVHAAVLLAVGGFLHLAGKVPVYKMPGTRNGQESLTYFTLGSATAVRSDIATKTVKPKPVSTAHSALAAPKTDVATSASTERGAGGLGQSGLGDGDVTIALEKYFPSPKPTLSALAPGSAGDVVLDAVIGPDGKVSQLTLLQGLGAPIDTEVMQTVNQWTFTPAMKNGVPVASMQELHFHYERRG